MLNPHITQDPQPVQQGSFDRLCGIYSVLNAILWIDPNSRHLRQRLFDSGLDFLISKNKLNSVMLSGMTRKVWMKVSHRILAERNRLSHDQLELCRISHSRRDSSKATWRDVADCTDSGWPVLAHLEGAYDHFTVISHVTPKRVVLYDSDGLHWLQRRSCGISGRDASKRFWIKPNSLVALRPKSKF